MPIEPLIITPADHPITHDMIDGDALSVLRKLNKAGFSSYLVGGGVRDLYRGKVPKDFDISTDARPGQIRRLFPNSRTIGRRFRLVQVFFHHNKIIEVSTLRSLSEHDLDGPEAVLAPNNTYGSLDEDAQRRDITINGLFYEIENQTIIDYIGGVDDLDNGVIRIIGTPEKRINRDPVRMMRVIRHSARSAFTISESSWQAVCQNSGKLLFCPSSRLRDELLKDIYSGASARWFVLAYQAGIFTILFRVYEDILDKPLPDGTNCRERLHEIFKTIDRYHNLDKSGRTTHQPDFFILAYLLVPWAMMRFNIALIKPKGPQLFQLAKQIREALNESLGPQLNLKRSTRQEITTLLAHLPVLISQHQGNGWPKWLKKKSYFPKCRLLYHFYQEAFEGEPVPDVLLSAKQSHLTPEQKKPRRQRGAGRKKGRPAFSGKRSGGVFGFKR